MILVPGDAVDILLRRHGHEIVHRPAAGPRHPEEAQALFDGVHGAIIASEPVTADMIDAATELQVLARSGVGYDSVDLPAATARRVRVCNTPGVNHDAVAEMTIALMLMSARRLTTTAVLINTARGSLVDEPALAAALDSGEIAGAALDVLDAEPMPAESRLRGRRNVIVTSHLAGQTVEARLRAGLSAAADVVAVLDGREPHHPVN